MSYFNQTSILYDASNMSAFGTIEASDLTPIIQGDWVYGINSQLWSYNYYFTVTTPGTTPVYGDIYTNNGNTFQIIYSVGTSVIAQGSGDPTASGNLTRVTGVGTTPIVYSAFTKQVGVTVGTGASVDANAGRLRIQCGTSTTSYAYITSRKIVKYRAGEGVMLRITPLFGTPQLNNVQLWGVGSIGSNTPYDGYFIGYTGTTFGIFRYYTGIQNFTPQSSFNGDKCDGTGGSGFNWNTSLGSPCMIKYPYLGYGDIEFFVQNPSTGRWILFHVIQYTNTSVSVQISNPSLQVIGYTSNNGNTINTTMYSGSVGTFISGQRSFGSSPRWAADSTKGGVSTESGALSLKNATTYNGVSNKGLIRLNSLSVANGSTSNNNVVTLRIRIGATLGGSPTFSTINGTSADGGITITNGNSIASIDTAATTVVGGTYIYNLSVGSSGNYTIDLTNLDLFVAPSEIATFSVSASASSTVGVSINWSEDI